MRLSAPLESTYGEDTQKVFLCSCRGSAPLEAQNNFLFSANFLRTDGETELAQKQIFQPCNLKILHSYYFYLYYSSAKTIDTPLVLQCTGGRANRIIDASCCWQFLPVPAVSFATFSQVSDFANICPWTQLDYHYAQIDQTLFKIHSL